MLSQLNRGWKDIHRRRLSEGAKQFADALGNQMRLTVNALGRGLISAANVRTAADAIGTTLSHPSFTQ